MTAPCEQESSIKNITSTLDRMEKGFDRLVELLQSVAQQGARLAHLEQEQIKTDDELNILYGRVRQIELKEAAGEPTTRLEILQAVTEVNAKVDAMSENLKAFDRIYKITTHKYAFWAYGIILGVIVLGFVNDVYYHESTLMKAWEWYHGK